MNDHSQRTTQDTKTFGVKGKEDKEQEKPEAGTGSKGEEKSLAEEVAMAERLDILEGSAAGEESKGEASVFRRVMDNREEDKSALDKAEQEQVLLKDWQTAPPEEKEKGLAKLEEKGEEERSKSSRKEGDEAAKEES